MTALYPCKIEVISLLDMFNNNPTWIENIKSIKFTLIHNCNRHYYSSRHKENVQSTLLVKIKDNGYILNGEFYVLFSFATTSYQSIEGVFYFNFIENIENLQMMFATKKSFCSNEKLSPIGPSYFHFNFVKEATPEICLNFDIYGARLNPYIETFSFQKCLIENNSNVSPASSPNDVDKHSGNDYEPPSYKEVINS